MASIVSRFIEATITESAWNDPVLLALSLNVAVPVFWLSSAEPTSDVPTLGDGDQSTNLVQELAMFFMHGVGVYSTNVLLYRETTSPPSLMKVAWLQAISMLGIFSPLAGCAALKRNSGSQSGVLTSQLIMSGLGLAILVGHQYRVIQTRARTGIRL